MRTQLTPLRRYKGFVKYQSQGGVLTPNPPPCVRPCSDASSQGLRTWSGSTRAQKMFACAGGPLPARAMDERKIEIAIESLLVKVLIFKKNRC